MGRKRNQFVNKKQSVTFHLEPADVAAMRRERENNNRSNNSGSTSETPNAQDDEMGYDRREWELAELGLPNDGYDYMQHLRDADTAFLSTLPPEATLATRVFVPENVTLYKRGVDTVDRHRMAVAASQIQVKDVDALDHDTVSAIDIENSGVVVADADGELDLEILHALNHIEDEDVEELGDDFFLLANEGLVGGPTLTESRLNATLTDAREKARADARREMLAEMEAELEGEDGDEDYDDDDDIDDKEFDGQYSEDEDDDHDHEGDYDGDEYKGQSRRARLARGDNYAYSVAESGVYQRSEAGKTMRSEALQQLDQHFEQFEKEYDDDEIGDLEDQADDINGGKDLAEMLAELNGDRKRRNEIIPIDGGFKDEAEKQLVYQQALRMGQEILSRPERPLVDERYIDTKPKEQWDAESYTSLFSNTEHHPTVISAPRRNTKKEQERARLTNANAPVDREAVVRFKLSKSGVALAGIPTRGDKLGEKAATSAEDTEEAAKIAAQRALMCTRASDETKEQKATRKSAVKAARAEARARKKGNRVAERQTAKQQNRAQAHLGPQTAFHL